MTTNNIQTRQENNTGNSFCEQTFSTPSGDIINKYRCNQKPLSVADVWNILRQSR